MKADEGDVYGDLNEIGKLPKHVEAILTNRNTTNKLASTKLLAADVGAVDRRGHATLDHAVRQLYTHVVARRSCAWDMKRLDFLAFLLLFFLYLG